MIHRKFAAALNDLRAMAGDVPAEVWERMRPAVAQLSGIESHIKNLETATIIVVAPVPSRRPVVQ